MARNAADPSSREHQHLSANTATATASSSSSSSSPSTSHLHLHPHPHAHARSTTYDAYSSSSPATNSNHNPPSAAAAAAAALADRRAPSSSIVNANANGAPSLSLRPIMAHRVENIPIRPRCVSVSFFRFSFRFVSMPVFLVLGFLSPSNQRGARRPPPWRSLTFRLMRGKSSHNPALPYFLKFIFILPFHLSTLPHPTLSPPALSPPCLVIRHWHHPRIHFPRAFLTCVLSFPLTSSIIT